MDTKQYIKVGQSLQKEFLVEDEHTAAHIGSGAIKVLATPMMIAFIEISARKLLDEYLPEGFSSVGSRVDIRHLAPTKIGKTVRVHVEVVEIEGKKISFETTVWDGDVKAGLGTHERYAIELSKFLNKLELG